MKSKENMITLVGILLGLIAATSTQANTMSIGRVNTNMTFQNDQTKREPSSLETPDEDKAETTPLSQEAINSSMDEALAEIQTEAQHYTTPSDVKEKLAFDARFPMRSHFTPGTLQESDVSLSSSVPPFFVMGDDTFSLKWLSEHVDILKERHMVGFITNVETKDRLETIESMFHVTLNPVALDGLETQLHVSHYPFWYESGKIRQ